ncbi:MAG: hypothetical protein IAE96_11095 [Chitinophagaceae bacterium]|nr:hypothetical protein [Chitinophagaceae bacterium]
MIRIITTAAACILMLSAAAQSLPEKEKKGKPVRIFSSGKTINARTAELTPAGKLDFMVTHNFGDLAGSNGGIKRFFGLDNAADIRIGFHLGVGPNTELVLARAKGAGPVQQLFETGIKQRLMQQTENDPVRPLSIAFYFNNVIAAQSASNFPDQENSFAGFGDRNSQTWQLILGKKMGNLSVQLNPTLVTRTYAVSYDQRSLFALGGAVRIPVVANRMNFLADYFAIFRKKAEKETWESNTGLQLSNPLGLGFEFLTAGHVFRLNFTNATEILENRFIPRTVSSWGKGQFRWGFTIARSFTLWRPV